MVRRAPWVVVIAVSAWAVSAAFSPTPAEDPLALVRAYWTAADSAERLAIAARVAAHPDYRPSRLREWLHRGVPYQPLDPGPHALSVDVGAGEQRRVHLVLPEGYRPDRAWPLVYALHPSGEPADAWAGQMVRMLGRRAREFVIASPEYRQNYIGARPPFVPEHPALLDAIARLVHVDTNRVYPFGYSRGGFAAWYVALYYPDRVAGAIAMAAGFDVAPGVDGLWKEVVGNVAHVPVLNTWGEHDALTMRGLDEQPVGTFAESNRRFAREVSGLRLPIVNLEVPGGRHNQLSPPPGPIVDILERRRAGGPRRVSHTFRHLHQASCYWLEGLSWVGARWGETRPDATPRDGESASRAIARTLEPLLGRLTGEIDRQTIRVTRQHIGDVVVWFGERSIDWKRPIELSVDGQVVFNGRLTADAGVALARAAATLDFDALRFAGVVVTADGRASVVTPSTMPEPAWRAGLDGAEGRDARDSPSTLRQGSSNQRVELD